MLLVVGDCSFTFSLWYLYETAYTFHVIYISLMGCYIIIITNLCSQVLIATSTLAWGVNFPAHLVVVKGTEYYDGKSRRYVDYPITGTQSCPLALFCPATV